MTEPRISRREFLKQLYLASITSRYDILVLLKPIHILFNAKDSEKERCDGSEAAFYPTKGDEGVFAFSSAYYSLRANLKLICPTCLQKGNCISNLIREQFPEDESNQYIDFYVEDELNPEVVEKPTAEWMEVFLNNSSN
jgi:hypothetical protein